MDENQWLAEQFEANRTHLSGVAYRMLGSPSEADDAVQETWLRLSRAYSSDIENLSGWLTTVVARVCLDMLRSRKSRREESLDAQLSERMANRQDENDPEHEALLTDSVGLALLVVLEALAPAERVAFVLHDLFTVPFDEIAPILGRSSTAARQLASRARRRVHGADTTSDADFFDQRRVASAFFTATRSGDFDALLAVLDPDVVRRADAVAVPAGGSTVERGAANVAAGAILAAGRATDSQLAWVNGGVGIVWAPEGKPRIVLTFTIANGKITAIDVIAEPARLSQLVPTYLDS